MAKEVADRLRQEHIEEEAKRRVGAAIAPPPALIQQDSNIESTTSALSQASTGKLCFTNRIFEEVFVYILLSQR